jgi:hypothetical protein
MHTNQHAHIKKRRETMMQELLQGYTTATPHREQIHGRLLEEIAWLEARLLGMGYTGDCAYEKKMARSYQELLQARRNELAVSRSPLLC